MKSLYSLVAAALIAGLGAPAFAAPTQCLNVKTIRSVLAPVYRSEGAFPVAMWQDVDDVPQLRRCGLALGPNDLRYVQSFGDLVGVVEWGLNKAHVCKPCP